MLPLSLSLTMLTFAQVLDAPPPRYVLAKGTTAYLWFADIGEDNRPNGKALDSLLFGSLDLFRRREAALGLDPESDEGKAWDEAERDAYERRTMLDVRPRTRVRILEFRAYVPDTPDAREELRRIEGLKDPAERERAIASLSTHAYRVEILTGNFRGRRGWVSGDEVVRTLPK